MARIIKFRGRSIADDSWVFGDLVHAPDLKTAIWPVESESNIGIIEVYPDSIGQFTNMRDCKGNEIYEGDIVRQTWTATFGEEWEDAYTANGTQTGIVVIRTKGVCISPCFSVNDTDGDSSIIRNKQISGYRCEVIGNKHDDPELIKNIFNV